MFIWNFGTGYFRGQFSINGMIAYPKFKMQEKISKYGLKVYMPIERDTEIGDSKLPASNYLVESLALLGKDINEGFCIKDEVKILWRDSN